VARFVLVHGAWHGGWCFQLLARELEDRGHEVSAPDLPCDRIGLTQEDYGRVIGPQSDAVVIGHSLGGQTIQLVEARMRIYLAAILPVENVYSHCFAAGFGGLLRDDLGRSYWPDPRRPRPGSTPTARVSSRTGRSRSCATRRRSTRSRVRSQTTT